MKVVAALRHQFGGHAVREGALMATAAPSVEGRDRRPRDGVVLFGATGDLAAKKLFPALYELERGRAARRPRHRRVVVGRGPTTSSASGPARAIEAAVDDVDDEGARPAPGAAHLRVRRLPRGRDLRPARRAGAGGRDRAAALLPRHPAGAVRRRDRRPRPGRAHRGRPGRRREAVRPRPRLGPRAQRVPAPGLPRGGRSSASTTSSARSRSRTCSCSGSPTRCSSRCGTATSSRACRSRWPRTSASGAGASSTRPSAPCATSCRTTCSRSSPCWPWSRRSAADADALPDEKTRLFRQVRTIDPADVVRGQYRGYADEDGVQAGSDVETFVALRFEIDSWRWAGVPWLIRTGKCAARPPPPRRSSSSTTRPGCCSPRTAPAGPAPNELRFRLGRNDGVTLHLQAKAPGDELVTQPVDLDVVLRRGARARGRRPTSGCSRTPSRATAAASAGPTASTSSGASSSAVLDDPPETLLYDEGSWGPSEADALADDVGGWRGPGAARAGLTPMVRWPRSRTTRSPISSRSAASSCGRSGSWWASGSSRRPGSPGSYGERSACPARRPTGSPPAWSSPASSASRLTWDVANWDQIETPST